MSALRLVVFDMAGTTLTDQHEVEQCFARAAKATGLSVTEERILAMQGLAKRFVFETLWTEQLGPDHPELKPRVDRSYQRFTEVLEEHYRTQPVTPTEGCLDAFGFLRERGIAIALTTGFYRKVTNIILERLAWLDGLNERYVGGPGTVIQASVASDEVPKGRPHPFLIQRAMQLLGVEEPKAVANIGDTPSDLLSGRAAGVALNLGVVNGTHSQEQLDVYPHDRLLASLHDLPSVLRAYDASLTAWA